MGLFGAKVTRSAFELQGGEFKKQCFTPLYVETLIILFYCSSKIDDNELEFLGEASTGL